MAPNRPSKVQQPITGLQTVPLMPVCHYNGDKPNIQLRSFIEQIRPHYDPDADSYSVPAFTQPISTSKVTAIYNMHSYWSKKPHDAIRTYIKHYTQPGDIVLDPMCGSGGTALAALMEGRNAVAIDHSPAATFITKNYCTPPNADAVARSLESLWHSVKDEFSWLYSTVCDRCGGPATTVSTVYSQVFQCPRCLEKIPLFDCVRAESHTAKGKPKTVNACPKCFNDGHVQEIRSQSKKFGAVPVKIQYSCDGKCKPRISEREHRDADPKKRDAFLKHDLAKIEEIEKQESPYPFPQGYDMTGFSRYKRDALYYYGVKEVSDLFTKRTLRALACLHAGIRAVDPPACREVLLFGLTALLLRLSRMNQYRPDVSYPTSIISGTYYLPQISVEAALWKHFENKIDRLLKGYAEISGHLEDGGQLMVSTQSATDLSNIPPNSIDYIFTDPPYGEKVQYGELNYVWEAWLGFDTKWLEQEIVVNETRGKSEGYWQDMMTKVMRECFRVLKPGRWLSLCFHDTSEGTWALVQDVMASVGFFADSGDTALYIDTGGKTFNQTQADKVIKRDLVVNFRKPRPGESMSILVIDEDCGVGHDFAEMSTNVIREFLTDKPGATKDRIYDELVSRMVRRGKMEAHDFDRLLSGVAEAGQESVGGPVRWYLKDASDRIDQREQKKEDLAAQRLEMYMREALEEHLENTGVHYSDLFQRVISFPSSDRPRRLLENWLPEYFFKTPEGTWRPPADEAERQQKAAVREAGTLRRMKRFANALLEEVPVRDQDRPDSDRTLAEWIRQCRRAGLYEQGRVMYEKGGLDLDRLDEDEQIEVEDDYRICVKRGSEEEAPKKSKSRKKTS